MAGTALKVRVGIFVVVGTVLAVGVVIGLLSWLGAEDRTTYVSYFSETTTGLDPDASVKYKGVKIGRVAEINVAPDGEHVEVVMRIDSSFNMKPGFNARVEYAGITGLRYIEIEALKEGVDAKPAKLSFKPEHPVIPSQFSSLEQLGDAIDKTLKNVNQLDVKLISDKLTSLLDNSNKLIAELKLPQTVENLNTTVKSLDKLMVDLDAKTLSKKTNAFLEEGLLLSRNLNATTLELQNMLELDDVLRATSETVKELNQTLKQSPSAMLFSLPPSPRLISKD